MVLRRIISNMYNARTLTTYTQSRVGVYRANQIDYMRVFSLLQSINQSIFIRQCNYKQTTTKCGRLPEQAIAQQSWPP